MAMEEITAEYAVSTLSPAVELRAVARVTVACKTDLGRVRENNEDKFEYYIAEDNDTLAKRGLIFVVCDGMGGHAAGQIASELATKTFVEVYLNHPASEAPVAMDAAVVAADRFVTDVSIAVPGRKGMGTTLSSLILLQDEAYSVQVGDSRVYRLRDGALSPMTTDHTWVNEAIEKGIISEAERETHQYRHVLTRAIGASDFRVQPDIRRFDLQEGDVYLLCSDGLLNHVPDPQIEAILKAHAPAEAAWKLVSTALLGGGSDNTTVMIVRVDSLERFQ
ncbi:MAG: PP2C family protein-serine/threonine phosphatase [Fimbriimonas sp.]